jgi:hypothetical protein
VGFLHQVDDALHSLNDVAGFGRVGLRFLTGAGAALGVAGAFTEAVGEVAATNVVEVTVKKPK